MEKISVIIPTFNRSSSLKRSIESVLNQTYKNIEIIIVDDNGLGSKENKLTKIVLQEIMLKDNRVKYVELEKNSGGSVARNFGIENSAGQYITFLDDDDEYYENKIEKQLKFYKEYFPKENGFINCQMDVFKNNKLMRTIKTHIDEKNLLFSAVNEKILGTPSLFIPKKLLYAVGLFTDRTKGQEWDLVVKLVEKGYDFKHMSDNLVRINVSENSITSDQNIDRKISGLENIYSKQCSYFQFFTKSEIKIINHSHYLKLSEAYLSNNLKKSFYCYVDALKNKFFLINNLRYPIKLILLNIKKVYSVIKAK